MLFIFKLSQEFSQNLKGKKTYVQPWMGCFINNYYWPALRRVHPSNESSIKFAQFCVKITKSSLVIQGVTRSSFNFLRFGRENLKLDMDISPRQ